MVWTIKYKSFDGGYLVYDSSGVEVFENYDAPTLLMAKKIVTTMTAYEKIVEAWRKASWPETLGSDIDEIIRAVEGD